MNTPTPCIDDLALDRAYAQILVVHVERLRHARPGSDSMLQTVESVVTAFDGVARVDEAFRENSAALAAHFWPEPGAQLWMSSASVPGQPPGRLLVTVQVTFFGKDVDRWCLVELCQEQQHLYRAVKVLALAEFEEGPTLFERAVTEAAPLLHDEMRHALASQARTGARAHAVA